MKNNYLSETKSNKIEDMISDDDKSFNVNYLSKEVERLSSDIGGLTADIQLKQHENNEIIERIKVYFIYLE